MILNQYCLKLIKPTKFLLATFFVFAFFIASFGGAQVAQAATKTATTSGNWSTLTWSPAGVPLSTDDVIINNGINVTVNSSLTINSIKFFSKTTGGANATGTLTVNSPNVLTVTTFIQVPSGKAGGDFIVTGTGTVNATTVNVNDTATPSASTSTTLSLTSTLTTFSISGNLVLNATFALGGSKTNNPTFSLQSGTTTVGGTIQSVNANAADISTLLMNGGVASGTLILNGATPWTLSGIGTNTITLNGTSATVKYSSGGAQSVLAKPYTNLILNGTTGVKSISTGTSISGNLSIAPTGTATASIGTGLNISVGTLTVGGVGTASGTWGSTSSTATNQNNTYFAATTGIVTVATNTRATQATLVFAGQTVTYPTTFAALSTTGGSGTGAVTYAVTTAGTAGCSVSGTTLSYTTAGTCGVTATKAADSNYNAASSTEQTFTISKGTQATLTVTAQTVTYPTTFAALASTGGSGTGAVTFALGSAGTAGCSVVGTTLSYTSAGTCTVTATKAADTNYNSTTSAAQTFTVNKGTQATLVFAGQTVSYPTTFAALSTTGGSGTGAVTYAVTTAGTAGCSVSGTTLSYTTAGTCGVTATKAADANFNVVSSTEATFTVNKGTQATLILTGQTVTSPTAFAALSTTGGSGTGAVTYAVTTAGTAGCSVSGTTLSYTSAGTCGVTATKATDTNYNAASSAEATFTVNKTNQAALILTGQTVSYPTTFAALSTTGGSGTGAVTYAVTTAGTAGCSVSGTTLSYTTAGTCGVTATKAADANFNVVSSTEATFTVNKGTQSTLTAVSTPSTVAFGSTAVLSSTGGDGAGAVTFSVGSSTGCNITGGTTLNVNNSNGTCNITATKAADNNYNQAVSSPLAVTLTAGVLDHFTISTISTQTAGSAFSITVTAKDVSNNTLTDYVGTVDLATNATSISPLLSNNFISGVLTQSVTILGAGTLRTVSVIDHGGTKSGVSNTFTLNNPTPTTTSITPTTKSVGDVGFSLTVDGTNFVPTSVVNFNGSVRATTYVSSTELTAAITTGDLSTPAVNSITVVNLTPGGGTSNAQTLTVNNPVPTITSISPSTKNVGDSGFTLTVNGKNFISGSVVKWNNSPRTTTFVSATRVTASILSSDLLSAGTASILVNNPAPGGGDSNAATFNILIPAVKFVIINPTDTTVGSTVAVTVQAQDASNAVVATYQNDVTLVTSGNATGAGVVDIINGVGTLNIGDETAETVALSLLDSQSTGLNFSSTQDVVFSASGVYRFTINTVASAIAGQRAAYTISRQDIFGNPVTTGVNTVYLYSSSTSGLGNFYDAATGGNVKTSIDITDGNSSVGVWYQEGRVGNYSITASDNSSHSDGPTGIDDASSPLAITAGPTSKFLLSHPGNMTVGNLVKYTVTREDAFSNLVISGTDRVYLTSSSGSLTKAFYDAATAGNVISFIDITGSASEIDFWYFDDTVGTVDITAYDNTGGPDGAVGIADAVDTLNVNLAPVVATKIIIVNPTDGVVASTIPVTIKAVNNAGDTDTGFNNSVTLGTTGSALGGGVVNIVGGIGSANLTDNTAETVNLGLVDSNATGLDTTSTQDVVFAPGPVTQFLINDPGDTVAGQRLAYSVIRKDFYNNLVTSNISTVYLYTNSLGSLGKFYDAPTGGNILTSVDITSGNSLANFWYEEGKAGSWTITVSDNSHAADGSAGIADANDPVVISPAAANKFLLNNPGDMTANTRLGYTVTREDAFGNLVIATPQTVGLSSSSTSTNKAFYNASTGGIAITTIDISAGNSSADFWYFDDTAGTYNITTSASGITSAVDSVAVSTAPIVATKIVIGSVAETLVGAPATVTVRAEDNSGNIATLFSGDVTLLATGSATGDGIVHLVSGVGTINISDSVSETVSLSLVDSAGTGLNVGSTGSIVFSTAVAPPSGGGGSVVTTPLGVNFIGSAFPGANINVLGLDKGQTADQAVSLKQQTTSGNSGTFNILLNNPNARSDFYVVSLTDKNNNTGQLKIFPNVSNIATLNNISFAPTVKLFKNSVRTGDFLKIDGFSALNSTVRVNIDGKLAPENAIAGPDGSYSLLVATAGLSLGKHSVNAYSETIGNRSDLSLTYTFLVANIFQTGVDFNGDGKVDIRDMNIFVSSWASTDPKVRLKADLNGDGKLDIQDLSIFAQALKR